MKRNRYTYKYHKLGDTEEEEDADEKPFSFPPLPNLKIPNNLFKLNDDEDIKGKANHIYFYDDVNQDTALNLSKKIKSLSLKLQELELKYDLDQPPKIYLHINSFGGCIFSAFNVVDTILQSSVPVVTIIEGASASAATLISIAGHERWMGEYAYCLIHQLSSGTWGKMMEIEDDFDNLKELTRRIKEHYRRFTKNKLKGAKLAKVLEHDIWWTSKDCLELGLIDKIITGNSEQIGNCINRGKKLR